MDAEQIVVAVDIYGTQYKIKGHSNMDYIKRVASSIDDSMQKLAKSNPRLDHHKLAVLCAMQITEEVFRLRRENARLLEQEAQLQDALKQLDAERVTSTELQQTLDAARKESADKLAEAIQSREERLFRQKREHEEELKRIRQELLEEKKAELIQLKSRLETEHAKREEAHDKQLKELQSRQELALTELSANVERERASWQSEKEQLLGEAEREQVLALELAHREWTDRWEGREAEWQAAAEREQAESAQLAEQRETYWQEQMQASAKAAREDLERRRNGWLEERSKLVAEKEQLQQAFAVEKKDLEERLSFSENQLMQGMEQEEALRSELTRLEQETAEQQKRIDEAELAATRFAQREKELVAGREEMKLQLQFEHQQKIEELLAEQRKLEQAEQSYAAQLKMLAERRAELEERLRDSELQLEEALQGQADEQSEWSQRRAELEERLRDSELQLEKALQGQADEQSEWSQRRAELEERLRDSELQLEEALQGQADEQSEWSKQRAELEERLRDSERGLEQLALAEQEAAAASELHEQWQQQLERMQEERKEADAASGQLVEKYERLTQEHAKLQKEYAMLQTEFNEWIELIDQS